MEEQIFDALADNCKFGILQSSKYILYEIDSNKGYIIHKYMFEHTSTSINYFHIKKTISDDKDKMINEVKDYIKSEISQLQGKYHLVLDMKHGYPVGFPISKKKISNLEEVDIYLGYIDAMDIVHYLLYKQIEAGVDFVQELYPEPFGIAKKFYKTY